MQVSLIVTSYNNELFILQCLDSILKNTIQGTELIICDDSSQDESAKIIESWVKSNRNAFERTVIIKHKQNYGVTQSLNELISECRGELISPIASDDFYLDGAVEERRKALVENPKWIGAFNDGKAIGLNGKIYSQSLLKSAEISPNLLNSHNIKKTILEKWIEPMNLQFWRRNAFKAHDGEFEFSGDVFCEDLNFAMWGISQNGFGYLNKNLYAYRCRSWPQTRNQNDLSAITRMHLDASKCYNMYRRSFSNTDQKYLKLKSDYYLLLAARNESSARIMKLKICMHNASLLFKIHLIQKYACNYIIKAIKNFLGVKKANSFI